MNPINFQPNSNMRRLQQQQQQQQQILLKYKLKQNEINKIQNQLRNQQQQQQTPVNNDITTINNDNNNDNSQKLAAIKSKIMTDYSNLYSSK
jgi:hypothetical protein